MWRTNFEVFVQCLEDLKRFIETHKRYPTKSDNVDTLLDFCNDIEQNKDSLDVQRAMLVESFPYYENGRFMKDELRVIFGKCPVAKDYGFFIPHKLLLYFAGKIMGDDCMVDNWEYTLLAKGSPYRFKLIVLMANIRVAAYEKSYARFVAKSSPPCGSVNNSHNLYRYSAHIMAASEDGIIDIARLDTRQFIDFVEKEYKKELCDIIEITDECFKCFADWRKICDEQAQMQLPTRDWDK